MARGQQKIQSQQKAQAKANAGKNKKDLKEVKKAAAAALTYSCSVCKAQMPDPKTYKQHFENKHPKSPLPEDLKST